MPVAIAATVFVFLLALKLYNVATSYRYAAPQRGRYREFWQASVEAIGSDDPAIDAEVIQLYVEVLRRLGIRRWELQLNSIGDRECRPSYVEQLTAWLDANSEALDEEARQKRATNPLRVFDTKNPEVAKALEAAPKIGDALCDACLDAYGVPCTRAPTLVRGLDYYTRTTWEFVGPEGGSQSALSGGGRYDYLVEEIGGPPTPAIGFGAGIERLVLALQSEEIEPPAEPEVDVFFLSDGEADRIATLPLLAELRREGIRADTDYAGRSRKGQLTQAKRLRAKRIVEPGTDLDALREELRE